MKTQFRFVRAAAKAKSQDRLCVAGFQVQGKTQNVNSTESGRSEAACETQARL